jgi:hypothetical protein
MCNIKARVYSSNGNGGLNQIALECSWVEWLKTFFEGEKKVGGLGLMPNKYYAERPYGSEKAIVLHRNPPIIWKKVLCIQ